MGKHGQSRQAKFGEKGEKGEIKDAPLMHVHFIHPKVQKYVQKCLKIAPTMSLKLIVYYKIKFLYSNFKNI
jgi:hypothetical protein